MGSLTSIGYTIPYSPGTLVSFAVLDSTGKSAGTSYLYTIQPSNNTACLSASKATTPALSMYVNATSLEACGQLGVGFQGGEIECYVISAFYAKLPDMDIRNRTVLLVNFCD